MPRKDTSKTSTRKGAKESVKNRGSLTLAELLEMDAQGVYGKLDDVPPKSDTVSRLTIPVRDWLKKYIAGKPVPHADSINPDDYKAVELLVSVLMDRGGVKLEMLPQSAFDYVEEWLYRLEEATDLHIWDVADIARPFLTLVLELAKECDSTEGAFESLQTALSQLCTEEELSRFYKRHGLDHKDARSYYKGSQKWRDLQVAVKTARVLADPTVSEEIKEPIYLAINELEMSSCVHTCDPALVERALVLMFESKNHMIRKAETLRWRKELRKLVNAVPDGEHTHKPASLKKEGSDNATT